jgi:hypothetical protein
MLAGAAWQLEKMTLTVMEKTIATTRPTPGRTATVKVHKQEAFEREHTWWREKDEEAG